MCLSSVIDRQFPRCMPGERLRDVTRRMMLWGCDDLPVCEESGRFLGSITSRSICLRVCTTGRSPTDLSVLDALSADVPTLKVDQTEQEAMELMIRERVWQIPVVDGGGGLVGIVPYGRVHRPFDRSTEWIVLLDGAEQYRSVAASSQLPPRWVFLTGMRELVAPDGVRMALSRGESRLLLALTGSPGKAISRDCLMQSVCNRDYIPGDRYIDVLVSNLRRKFGERASDALALRTVHNSGYALSLNVLDWRRSTGNEPAAEAAHPPHGRQPAIAGSWHGFC